MSVPWYLMAKGKGGGGYKTASGPIVSVNDALAAPLRSLLVNIDPVQAGTGDPSPDNVRPISGWSAVNVWLKPTYDPTENPTATLQLGQTVYGGTLDVTNGVLTVTMGAVDLGSFDWIDETEYVLGQFRVNFNQIMALGARYSNVLCSILKGTRPQGYKQFEYGEIGLSNSPDSQMLRARAVSFEGASAASVKEFFTGQTLVYELATPIEYTLTPQQISSLVGENNVWADTGDVTVEYESSGSNPDLMKLAVAFMGRK